jgi:hypothetical protein
MSNEPFAPEHFLNIAEQLAGDDANEAMFRTAVGRAYYAVFLLARARSGVIGQSAAHARVRTALSPASPRLASLLGTMANLRNVADYDLLPADQNLRDWRRNWGETRRNATRVLEELAKLP